MAVMTSSSSLAGAGGGGGIVRQGTLLNVVKNIFPFHGMHNFILKFLFFLFFLI